MAALGLLSHSQNLVPDGGSFLKTFSVCDFPWRFSLPVPRSQRAASVGPSARDARWVVEKLSSPCRSNDTSAK